MAARRHLPERVVTMLIFLIARTERDAWKAIGKYEDAIPELAEARIITTHGGNWAEGARVERAYVAPGADTGPYYDRVIRVVERSMIKMRESDKIFRKINPDGSWTEATRDALRVQ